MPEKELQYIPELNEPELETKIAPETEEHPEGNPNPNAAILLDAMYSQNNLEPAGLLPTVSETTTVAEEQIRAQTMFGTKVQELTSEQHALLVDIVAQRRLSPEFKGMLTENAEALFRPKTEVQIEKLNKFDRNARNELPEVISQVTTDPVVRQNMIDVSLAELQRILIDEADKFKQKLPKAAHEEFDAMRHEIRDMLLPSDASIENFQELADRMDALKTTEGTNGEVELANDPRNMRNLGNSLVLLGSFIRAAGKSHYVTRHKSTAVRRLPQTDVENAMDLLVAGMATKECVKRAEYFQNKKEEEARSTDLGAEYQKFETYVPTVLEKEQIENRKNFTREVLTRTAQAKEYVISDLVNYHMQETPPELNEIPVEIYEAANVQFEKLKAANPEMFRESESENINFADLEILYRHLKSDNSKVSRMFEALIVGRRIEVAGKHEKKDRFGDIRAGASLGNLDILSQEAASKLTRSGVLLLSLENEIAFNFHYDAFRLQLGQMIKEGDYSTPNNVSEIDPGAANSIPAYDGTEMSPSRAWINEVWENPKSKIAESEIARLEKEKRQQLKQKIGKAFNENTLLESMDWYIADPQRIEGPKELSEAILEKAQQILNNQQGEKTSGLEINRRFAESMSLRYISQYLAKELEPVQIEEILANVIAAEAMGSQMEEEAALLKADFATANLIRELESQTNTIRNSAMKMQTTNRVRAQREVTLQALPSLLALSTKPTETITGHEVLK